MERKLQRTKKAYRILEKENRHIVYSSLLQLKEGHVGKIDFDDRSCLAKEVCTCFLVNSTTQLFLSMPDYSSLMYEVMNIVSV